MKKIIFFLILFVAFRANAQSMTKECVVRNNAFQGGEKLVYKVAYKWGPLWLNAGQATLTVENSTYNNKPCLHVTGYGETYKSYDWFYKIRDTYETYIDPTNMQPLKFVRNVSEGKTTIYNNVTFKHNEGKAISTNGSYTVPYCIQDVLSSIYYARCIDFSKYKPDDIISITIFLDDSVYPLYIHYIGKQVLKASSGTYKCIVFRPLLIKGSIFKGGEDMTLYVTDDENKIPIRISTPIIVGEILAELESTDGLRNPVTAKLK